ncbi:MAG TPA: glutathione S-transferase family protein [Solirubrobacterales bacterium]|nr:glutathione S-transferase family protein [Solirubrobacterales bacterium]
MRIGREDVDYHLFWCPGTCSRVTFTALMETGASFEATVVNRYGDPSDTAGYLEINPKGRVPTLVVDGHSLTETPAILTYLARRHPDASVLPRGDAYAEIDALVLTSWFAAGVHRYITPFRFPHTVCDRDEAYPTIQDVARGHLEAAFALLEDRLSGQEWLFAEWSVADAYMLWLWFRATGSGMDGRQFPGCLDHARRCELRPSVASVLEREESEYQELERTGSILVPDSPFLVGRSPSFADG